MDPLFTALFSDHGIVFDNKVELTFRVLYQTQDPYPRLILESYHTNFPTLCTWCIWLIVLREAETQ